ncbi:hypothetical protein, partial [Rubrivirga sp.]|uniref:hypothetical protein n=1 Tax=Rubrivirga sp. TaxID=1885344 RepID=UPI003C75E260
LDEIERLGRDSGIDPAHLRAAASEMDTVGRTLDRQTSQTKTEVIVERWIDAPFRIEAWEDVVAHVRQTFGASIGSATGSDAGETVRQIGSTYEWSHTSNLGVRTRVTVSPRDGRTRLRMTQIVGTSTPTVDGIGYGFLVALLPTLLVMLGVGQTDLGAGTALPIMFASFLVFWAVCSPIVTVLDRRWRAKKLRALDALADDLTPILNRVPDDASPGLDVPQGGLEVDPLEAEVPEADAFGVDASDAAPFLDLDALDDLEDGGLVKSAVRRWRSQS